MIAGPELSRLVGEYESVSERADRNASTKHHDHSISAQKGFQSKIQKLVQAMSELGNPFLEDSKDLLVLDTKDVVEAPLDEISSFEKKGKEQYQNFMNEIQCDPSAFYKAIPKNKFQLFKDKAPASKANEKSVKEDCHLFSRLFISCQTRDCDLNEFFQHENQTFPASLSNNGQLHACQKSQLVDILTAEVVLPEAEPEADAIIIDGSAFVNSVPPQTTKSFHEYAQVDVIPKIQRLSSKYSRTDIVFDIYKKSSLKAGTRKKRGKGIRRRVKKCNKTPRNWSSFMRDSNNKTELFSFLADEIAASTMENPVTVTKGEIVVSSHEIPLGDITPCSHEEADSRIFVHAKNLAEQGFESIIVKANDTDVVAIAVSVMTSLEEMGLHNLWIEFGQGFFFRWIPIHEVVHAIGPQKARAMLYFHAFSGLPW